MIKPLMRQLENTGELTGPALELMKPFPKEMLFDLQHDPHEIHNLAGEPDHAVILQRMRARP